jgi:hypothetical protein
MNYRKQKRHDPEKCSACSIDIEHSLSNHAHHESNLSLGCDEHLYWSDGHVPIMFEETLEEDFYRAKYSLDRLRRSELKLFTTKTVE